MSHRQNREPIKFAYWVPNVSGGLVISSIEQRTNWTIEYNQKLAQIAEKAGFDYALTQIRFTAGYGAEYQHESVSFSYALLNATERALLQNPPSSVEMGPVRGTGAGHVGLQGASF